MSEDVGLDKAFIAALKQGGSLRVIPYLEYAGHWGYAIEGITDGRYWDSHSTASERADNIVEWAVAMGFNVIRLR